jgi:hypothetical protein
LKIGEKHPRIPVATRISNDNRVLLADHVAFFFDVLATMPIRTSEEHAFNDGSVNWLLCLT